MPNMNSNQVTLIPKFKEVDKIKDYTLIALANFQFKIITKVLVDRLTNIVTRIISEERRGYSSKVDRGRTRIKLIFKCSN